MINVYPADSRGQGNHGWLKARYSFSFSHYYDPDNTGFGPMVVLNDDIVQPSRGFGMHGHREMEIVTIVLRGRLRHQDSMGNTETIEPGQLQRMSAGTGIMHSETNPSPDEEVNLLQMWFEPNESGLAPSYEMVGYNREGMAGRLLPVVSGRLPETTEVGTIHQDLTIYLSELAEGQEIAFEQEAGRRTFLFVIDGDAVLNGEHRLSARDSARVSEETSLRIAAAGPVRFMLIDLP